MREIVIPLGSIGIFLISVSIGYAMRKYQWRLPVSIIVCIAFLLAYLFYAAEGAGWAGIGWVIVGMFAILPICAGLICGLGFGWFKNTRAPDDVSSHADR
ncbi:hypothetical protein [Ahrensia kielensis]|uniref:hypothetical protein n=1 Tax=Ahrensia kielensis TaxID=76980 RepID=UPI000366E691|nr:hypothetical protein [Ahrensia kielensis]